MTIEWLRLAALLKQGLPERRAQHRAQAAPEDLQGGDSTNSLWMPDILRSLSTAFQD